MTVSAYKWLLKFIYACGLFLPSMRIFNRQDEATGSVRRGKRKNGYENLRTIFGGSGFVFFVFLFISFSIVADDFGLGVGRVVRFTRV